MRTRAFSASVANKLHSIRGATCCRIRLDRTPSERRTRGCPFSSAIRRARRSANGAAGRNTSVGQVTNRCHHRSQALELASPISARRDKGLKRRSFVSAKDSQDIGVNRAGLRAWRDSLSPVAYPLERQRRGPGLRKSNVRAQYPRRASAKGVPGAGDEHAGAAGLAPHALVARAGARRGCSRRGKACARRSKLAVEQMQLLDAGMAYAPDRSRRARGAPAC